MGSIYNDLGVIVTDNIDTNLGYHMLVNGVEVLEIQIDTSTPGEHTVEYRAADSAGNSASATRTVIVQDPVGAPAPDPEQTPNPAPDPAPEPTSVPDTTSENQAGDTVTTTPTTP